MGSRMDGGSAPGTGSTVVRTFNHTDQADDRVPSNVVRSNTALCPLGKRPKMTPPPAQKKKNSLLSQPAFIALQMQVCLPLLLLPEFSLNGQLTRTLSHTWYVDLT